MSLVNPLFNQVKTFTNFTCMTTFVYTSTAHHFRICTLVEDCHINTFITQKQRVAGNKLYFGMGQRAGKHKKKELRAYTYKGYHQ